LLHSPETAQPAVKSKKKKQKREREGGRKKCGRGKLVGKQRGESAAGKGEIVLAVIEGEGVARR